jgi:hypothetical protein
MFGDESTRWSAASKASSLCELWWLLQKKTLLQVELRPWIE